MNDQVVLSTLKRQLNRSLFKYRLLTSQKRVLPDFFLIGAMRSGTSFLFNRLAQHPEIITYYKEIRYFDNFDGNYSRGLTWYRAHFPLDIRRRARRVRGEKLITGEGTPYYIYHPLAPERVKELVPWAKFILVLRNPVDRAYSHYCKNVKNGLDPKPFAEVVNILETVPFSEASLIAVEGLETRRARWLEQRPKTYPRLEHAHNNAYLCWGTYVEYLTQWLKFFPLEQILIVRSEDMFAQPDKELNSIFRFLGVSTYTLNAYSPLYKPRNYNAMDPAIRERLVNYYKPHNQKLYELLGRDMNWDH